MGIEFNHSVTFAAPQDLVCKNNQLINKPNTSKLSVRQQTSSISLPKITAKQAIVYFISTNKVGFESLISKIKSDKIANKLGTPFEHLPRNDRTDAETLEKVGFPPIIFLWAWMNNMSNRKHYHKTTDRPEIANYNNLEKSIKLALATAYDLAKIST